MKTDGISWCHEKRPELRRERGYPAPQFLPEFGDPLSVTLLPFSEAGYRVKPHGKTRRKLTQGTKNTVQGWTLHPSRGSWLGAPEELVIPHPPPSPFPPFGEAIVIRLKEFTQCGDLGLTSFLPDPEHLILPRTKSLSYPAPVGTS